MTHTTWRLVHFDPWDILVNADARGLGDGGYGFEGEIAPAAFAGAIRTLVLRHNGYDFTRSSSAQTTGEAKEAAQAVGLDGGDFPFRFAGPFLCARGLLGWDLYLSAPAHLLHAPQDEQVPAGWLIPVEQDRVADDGLAGSRLLSICAAPFRALEQAEPLEGWAHAAHLQKILLGDLGGIANLPSERDFFALERKEGHRRSEKGTVEEGQLFSRGALRFQDQDSQHRPANRCFAGLISLDEKLLPNATYDIRLAGDGRPVRLRVEPADQALAPLLPDPNALAQKIHTTKRFLLYLATPAIFKQGWRPRDWATTLGTPKDLQLTLYGACVFRPRILGGWDLKKKAPKNVRRAVPPGSVYFFRYENDCGIEDITEWLKALAFQRPLSDEDGSLGYGWALAGLWPEVGTENGGQ